MVLNEAVRKGFSKEVIQTWRWQLWPRKPLEYWGQGIPGRRNHNSEGWEVTVAGAQRVMQGATSALEETVWVEEGSR